MKKKKTLAVTYYMLAIVWFALAASYMTNPKHHSIGVTYMAIAVMWLGIGGVYYRHGKNNQTTIDYYNQNAAVYVASTENADMSDARERFLKYVSEGGRILDWGCGSGRDSLAFLEAGYKVDAIDGAEEICKLAHEKTGLDVKCESFDELDANEIYDGIWACASLLHISKDYIPETIKLARKALKPNGVMYMSFKLGDKEGERDGRFFMDMTQEKYDKLMKRSHKVQVLEQWTSADVREDRIGEQWFNILIKRVD